MGAWGVKATESDYGMDLLLLIEREYLQARNFEQFNVGEIAELLKTHIVEQIRHSNRGASQEDIDFYIEVNFPGDYDQAVMLMSELLAEYFECGEIVIDAFEDGKKKPTRKKIANVIYSPGDLTGLLADLQAVLDPDRAQYCAWEESDSFGEWQSHVKRLCDCLQNQIDR